VAVVAVVMKTTIALYVICTVLKYRRPTLKRMENF